MQASSLFQRPSVVRSSRWWLALGLGAALALASGCGSSDGAEDAGAPPDAGSDSGPPVADAGECAGPEAGVGVACDTSDDCSCDTVCELGACAPPVGCDEALLSWDAPTDREDGTCLPNDELGGFSVQWSLDEAAIGTDEATVEELGLPCIEGEEVPCGTEGQTVPQLRCSHRLTDLPEGEVFFALRTHAADGLQSQLSAVASKVIDCD